MIRLTSKLMPTTSMAARQSIRMSRPVSVLARRCYTTEQPLPTPGTDAKADPKIAAIVDQIETLTLLQTSELVAQLKSRLNIQDIAMPVAMPAAGAPAAGAAAEEEKPAEKTDFNIKIEKVDASAKAKVIREVKNLAGLNLVEAKKFVESVPKVLKETVPKEEAEKLKKALEAVGATVILE
ncbi:ribosomal protein L7/L12 C-terminal domain-containing protein [Radiomyces spectabilis]|uniref:ribosomal protein L7/L12 C-terminal domain-containing protein n=1 Tax=Radiomyces spectabilis TaxID=64574 RepID=UPI0022203D38|nr:ribosomal protein L7/L12 C-terminal domain-containing protein [Radiomyces spectabilis]KAI8388028.1 ribosomal protein L7/L12 C-terminal domain-containing protein [Radiomyces spectabilis]